jgi:uncharacterized protein (TIGR03435 family)
MKSAKALLCVLFFSVLAAAQATPSKPAFVSATVKPSVVIRQPKKTDVYDKAIGTYVTENEYPVIFVNASYASYISISLKQLIGVAYEVKENHVSGPAWLNDPPYYDIMAKMPAGASVNDAPKMLKTLLEVRFKLAVHTKLKNQQVLALVVAKGGPKLQPATDWQSDGMIRVTKGSHGSVRSPSVIEQSDGMTMEQFANLLTMLMPMGGEGISTGGVGSWSSAGNGSDGNRLDLSEYGGDWKVVVDRTGLKGEYQVAVEHSPFAPGFDPLIFSSVQNLGLKLQLSTLKVVERVVVDHAEKNPTAN